MTMNERLKQARLAAGYETATQAAETFGWAYPTYSGHENGSRDFSAKTARRYADAFRVAVQWLLLGVEPKAELAPGTAPSRAVDADSRVEIASYAISASAGNGSVVDDYAEVADRLTLPKDYLRTFTSAPVEFLAIIGVKGDSMIPTLQDDDIVMIDTRKTNLGYDGLFVLNLDGALHVKRISRGNKSGTVMIISDNDARYRAIERPVDDVHVVGKVVWKGTRE